VGKRFSRPSDAAVLEAISAEAAQKPGSTRSLPNRHRDRGGSLDEIDNYSDADFQAMMRMTRVAFEELFTLVAPFLHDTNEAMAIRSSGKAIAKKTKLYVTLCWLPGGSHLDLCFGWRVSKAAFFSTDPARGCLWPTIEAIDKALVLGVPFHDREALVKLSDEYASYTNGQMKGCIMAIDGWVARTRKPFVSEVGDVNAYRNRHGCWGLVILAGCDARCRFLMWSCKNSGSTNDCLAWSISQMKVEMDAGRLPCDFYIIGDEAFSCTDQLLVPYGGRGLGVWKDSFNYHLSSMRQCIERAFALYVQRWGIVWRALRTDFNRWPLVLTVCAKLHNFCIDRQVPLCRGRSAEDYRQGIVLKFCLMKSP
jgi:hypothetical protein